MAALPNFDDPWRVASPWEASGETYEDAPQVSRERAVDAVIDCLIGRNDRAFGEDAEWWMEIINDAGLDKQNFRSRSLMLLAPNACGSSDAQLRQAVGDAVEHEANRLLCDSRDAIVDAMLGGVV